jgi:Transposase DDE domain
LPYRRSSYYEWFFGFRCVESKARLCRFSPWRALICRFPTTRRFLGECPSLPSISAITSPPMSLWLSPLTERGSKSSVNASGRYANTASASVVLGVRDTLWSLPTVKYKGRIVAQQGTGRDVGDCEVLEELLHRIPNLLIAVAADGAYDTRWERRLIEQRLAQPLIPPRENAGKWREEVHGEPVLGAKPRNTALDRIEQIGMPAWKEEIGYHVRSLVENTNFRIKTLFGERLASRRKQGRYPRCRNCASRACFECVFRVGNAGKLCVAGSAGRITVRLLIPQACEQADKAYLPFSAWSQRKISQRKNEANRRHG